MGTGPELAPTCPTFLLRKLPSVASVAYSLAELDPEEGNSSVALCCTRAAGWCQEERLHPSEHWGQHLAKKQVLRPGAGAMHVPPSGPKWAS